MMYRGWWLQIDFTKGYVGRQHGVECCARTREELCRVIDLHIADKEAYIASRKD